MTDDEHTGPRWVTGPATPDPGTPDPGTPDPGNAADAQPTAVLPAEDGPSEGHPTAAMPAEAGQVPTATRDRRRDRFRRVVRRPTSRRGRGALAALAAVGLLLLGGLGGFALGHEEGSSDGAHHGAPPQDGDRGGRDVDS